MLEEILRLYAEILRSAAFAIEVQAMEADARAGTTIPVVDANGTIMQVSMDYPLPTMSFAQVIVSDPPRRVGSSGGPWPVAYVHHMTTDTKERDQEAEIIYELHRWGVMIWANGNTPTDAQLMAGRLGAAARKLIERNQSAASLLPRAHGSSSITEVVNIMANQRGAATIYGYHISCVTRAHEYRTLT